VVLDSQIGERAGWNLGQRDVDGRHASLIKGVLDKLADQPALAVLLGLPAKTSLVHREPVLRHRFLHLPVEFAGPMLVRPDCQSPESLAHIPPAACSAISV